MLVKRKEYYPTLFDSAFTELVDYFLKNNEFDLAVKNLTNSDKLGFVVKHDYYETSNDFVFEIPLPGLKKDDVSIEIDKNIINVKAEKKEIENVKYYTKSIFAGRYDLSYKIPENTDKENIDATMENGILKIKIPKIQKKKDEEKLKIAIK